MFVATIHKVLLIDAEDRGSAMASILRVEEKKQREGQVKVLDQRIFIEPDLESSSINQTEGNN